MINLLLTFLPSFIHVYIRKMLGAKIGPSSRIKWGTYLRVDNKNLHIGKNTSIGPFVYISASRFSMGDNGVIKPLSIISTSVVEFKEYVHLAPLIIIHSDRTPNAKIVLDDHVRVFPFSWLEPGEGIYVGKQSSVGTYDLIYTHGVWADYLKGGPVAFGPVVIEENVWLPPRVFILPGTTIGRNSIIAGNSVVTKSIPPHSMAAGAPAKVIKENIMKGLSEEELKTRIETILKGYIVYAGYQYKQEFKMTSSGLHSDQFNIVLEKSENAQPGDLLFVVNNQLSSDKINQLVQSGVSIVHYPDLTYYHSGKSNMPYRHFPAFLRRYGIRLYMRVVNKH